MQVNKKQINEAVVVFLTIALALIVLTPGNFGEFFGGETWKAWAASKILLVEGNFIDHTFGPLYYIFLTILSPLNYQNSIIIEYLISHFFCLFAIYKFLNLKNSKLMSILLPIAWIPFLAYVQSPKYILAIAFIFFHLSKMHERKLFDNWLPPFLLAAVACNWGYILFYIAHIIGKFLSDFKDKKNSLKLSKNNYSIFGFVIILLFIFCYTNQSHKPYNNHFVAEMRYLPIESTSPFVLGFFQYTNHRYSQQTYKNKNDLIKADWYFTHKIIFGDCKDFLCVLKEKPETLLINIKPNIGWLSRHVTALFFGLEITTLKLSYFIIFFILALSISFLGIVGLLYNKTQKILLLSYIFIGSFGYTLALLITGAPFRYVISLMPICFLLINFSGLGIASIKKKNDKKLKLIESKHVFILIFTIILVSDIVFYKKNKFGLQFVNLLNQNKSKSISQNYFKSYDEVFIKLNKKQKILSLENHWIVGFADVNPNNVKGIYILPPFIPKDYSITKFLDEFDVITVSDSLKKEVHSMSTQRYLRYKIHIKKYFEKNLNKWNETKIKNYGSIFVRIK